MDRVGLLSLCRSVMLVHESQPGLLPVEATLRLTSAVAGAVAAKVLQKDGVAHASAPSRPDEIADLLRPLSDSEATAHMLEHLRHERDAIDRSVAIERREDLRSRAHLDEIAGAQGSCLGSTHLDLTIRA
jgi:hypothetical protein